MEEGKPEVEVDTGLEMGTPEDQVQEVELCAGDWRGALLYFGTCKDVHKRLYRTDVTSQTLHSSQCISKIYQCLPPPPAAAGAATAPTL